ncbi:P-loop containing nucleoside triphosphate hydrolase protein [Viridothelium virens]|uniref:P-loop containing nucleoside triphosphate hydrolase protein n=1 Tax=Viridothelium virens TaxID=1048519 RepID=A0A6A6HFL0_VIRVR|nr:P-loop containing nucleoside triphosphate hydrolase protein [Viridothelium virens]
MRSPFTGLVQAEEEANKICDESEQFKTARVDLKELLRVISSSSGVDILDRYFRDRPQLLKDKKITFEALFTLFPPGKLIIAKPFMNTEQVFFVMKNIPSSIDDEVFEVICYTLDWDGENFLRVPYEMRIEFFDNTKDIAELPFYPLEYYTSEGGIEALRRRLQNRGVRWRELCTASRGKQMFTYKGPAYSQRNAGIFRPNIPGSAPSDSDSGMFNGRSSLGDFDVQGTVIIDFRSYYSYQTDSAPLLGEMRRWTGMPVSDCTACRSDPWRKKTYRFDWDRITPRRKLTNEQALCCPPRVLGYSMEKKKWMQLHVDNVKDWSLSSKNNVFEKDLQLDQNYKDLIQKSVKSHETTKEQNRGIDDFAEGKGKGLVILLYGAPGVGKTLTAESVATLARKPLFPVGVSDIGIDGQNVETHLQRVFDLAGLWEAVLLFDEADVFLEARGEGISDLRRNTMVSDLLRVLEYYEGILILTTNRLRSFDIAVQSRIHLAIKYVLKVIWTLSWNPNISVLLLHKPQNSRRNWFRST